METVNIRYLIGEVADELEWSKRDVKQCIDMFFEIIADEINEGNEIALAPYVTFRYTYKRPIKKGTMVRNPFTGGMSPSKGRPAAVGLKARIGVGLRRHVPDSSTKTGKEIIRHMLEDKKKKAVAA